ncbi:MAG: histidine kinase [Bacteroidetes bacterium]|nr:histidine kinase [Bacteroidota bacterium]
MIRINKITIILTSPFLLSLFLLIPVVYFIPTQFSKYKTELLSTTAYQSDEEIFYYDLDIDGESEKILLLNNSFDGISLSVFKQDAVINQWNFEGKICGTGNIFFSDLNSDGITEISLIMAEFNPNYFYLYSFDPINSKSFVFRKKIDSFSLHKDFWDSNSEIKYAFDNNQDGMKEIYFFITSAFSLQPRNIYCYDIKNDSLIKSIKSYASNQDLTMSDLNNDSVPEFYCGTLACGNSGFDVPFTDQFSYLFGFDEKLELLFKPKPFSGFSSRLHLHDTYFNHNHRLFLYHCYQAPDSLPNNYIAFVNKKGVLVEKCRVGQQDCYIPTILQIPGQCEYIYFRNNKRSIFYQYDSTLCLTDSIYFGEIADRVTNVLDLNDDGSPEYIFQSKALNSLIITQADLSHPVELQLPERFVIKHLSLIKNSGHAPLVFLQTKDESYYHEFKFYKNPYYTARYLMIVGDYLIILLIISFISKTQKIRLQNKLKEEKELAELQLQATKKQLDPHFTLNLMDSIGNLYYENDRKTGNYIFGKFARLLRQTITNSDRLIIPLSEEIQFVEDYLSLEQFKYGGKFDFEIITNGISLSRFFIPGMFVHTFVENAIKHGIRHSPQKGFIKINVSNTAKGRIEISIVDNGIGREAAKKKNQLSTGKGLEMIDALKKHYNKTNKYKISYQIIDLYDDNACASGTKVVILTN